MESRVHSSLHENCHHQITSAKFNLKMYYLPPYEQETWHNRKANIENIRKAISEFPQGKRFANSDFNEKVYLYSKHIKNIVSSDIPHKTIICIDRDLSWNNKNIKNRSMTKTMHTHHGQNENSSLTFQNFQFLRSRSNSPVEKFKHKYYARFSKKLLDPMNSPNLYWAVLKTLLNN